MQAELLKHTGQTVSGALESCSHLPCLCCCSSTVIVYHLCLCSCLPAVQANSSAYGRCTSRVTDASRAFETHCNDTGQTVVGAGTIIAIHLMHCSLALTVHVWFLNWYRSGASSATRHAPGGPRRGGAPAAPPSLFRSSGWGGSLT